MNYVSEAAELFLTLNPDIPFLSPFDYLLIAEWEKQEIPLFVVLKAIRQFQVEGETAGQDRFSYLKQDVKAHFAAWLKAGVRGSMVISAGSTQCQPTT